MDYKILTKTLVYVLRHKPEDYGLVLDNEGFVSINDLIIAMNNKKKFERDIVKDEIINIVNTDYKERFEIKNEKIRAIYGHTNGIETIKEENEPPEFLYYGVVEDDLIGIAKQGIKCKTGQYIHFSSDFETALQTAQRKKGRPVIFKILAQKAFKDKVKFYKITNKIWLCKDLPLLCYIEQTEYVIFLERTDSDVLKLRSFGPNRMIDEKIEVYSGETQLSKNGIRVFPSIQENKDTFFKKIHKFAQIYNYKNYLRVKLSLNDCKGNYLHTELVNVENNIIKTLAPIFYCNNVSKIKNDCININMKNSRKVGHILFLGLILFRKKHPEIEEIENVN